MWRFLAGLAVAAGLLTGGYFAGRSAGWDARDARAKGDQLAATDAQLRDVQAAQRSGFEAGMRSARRQTEIRETVRLIHDQVPRLVTPDVDRRYPLPVGFVRLVDAAAAGEVPAAAGPADGEASGVAASRAAAIIGDNYGACRGVAQQLIDLQDWAAKSAGLSIEDRGR
jgi:hypothetical protein